MVPPPCAASEEGHFNSANRKGRRLRRGAVGPGRRPPGQVGTSRVGRGGVCVSGVRWGGVGRGLGGSGWPSACRPWRVAPKPAGEGFNHIRSLNLVRRRRREGAPA